MIVVNDRTGNRIIVEGRYDNILNVNELTTRIVETPNNSIISSETRDTRIIHEGTVGPTGPQGEPGLAEDDVPYSKRIDFITDNELYRGEADPGSAEGNAVWRIRKITIAADNDIVELWAAGDANFDKVWDNRLSYTYI